MGFKEEGQLQHVCMGCLSLRMKHKGFKRAKTSVFFIQIRCFLYILSCLCATLVTMTASQQVNKTTWMSLNETWPQLVALLFPHPLDTLSPMNLFWSFGALNLKKGAYTVGYIMNFELSAFTQHHVCIVAKNKINLYPLKWKEFNLSQPEKTETQYNSGIINTTPYLRIIF